MSRVNSLIIIALCYLAFIPKGLNQIANINDVQISVITCDPGNQLETMYGHNALRVLDPYTGSDVVYNWGTFDFNTPNFMIKFMRGKLPYTLSVANYSNFLYEYRYHKRGVTEQVLKLDSIQKINILTAVAKNMLPENKEYKYDFFMDNCATRIRDILTKSVPLIQVDDPSSSKTFRTLIKEYQAKMPWTDFGIDIIIGSKADKLANASESCFLPDYLSSMIGRLHIENSTKDRLVSEKRNVLSFSKFMGHGITSKLWQPWFFFLLLLFLEILLFFRYRSGGNQPLSLRYYDNFWMSTLVFVSIVILVMWFLTDHVPTKNNFNLLWANPLWILWFKYKNTRWFKYCMSLLLIISIVNSFYMFLPQYFHHAFGMICAISTLKVWRTV
jgi:hypothetical protein